MGSGSGKYSDTVNLIRRNVFDDQFQFIQFLFFGYIREELNKSTQLAIQKELIDILKTEILRCDYMHPKFCYDYVTKQIMKSQYGERFRFWKTYVNQIQALCQLMIQKYSQKKTEDLEKIRKELKEKIQQVEILY